MKHRYRFDPISFFPRLKLNEILNIEFDLCWFAKMQINNNMDWREVYYYYERLVDKIKEQNKEQQTDMMRMGNGRR